MNRDRKKMQSMRPTKRARSQTWLPLTVADIEALLGVVMNMCLQPVSDFADYFSLAWVNKIPFFSDVFQRKSFFSCTENVCTV
jgi:hypothetical protein